MLWPVCLYVWLTCHLGQNIKRIKTSFHRHMALQFHYFHTKYHGAITGLMWPVKCCHCLWPWMTFKSHLNNWKPSKSQCLEKRSTTCGWWLGVWRRRGGMVLVRIWKVLACPSRMHRFNTNVEGNGENGQTLANSRLSGKWQLKLYVSLFQYVCLTTHEAAWCIISVVSVCLSEDNFRRPWRSKFIFARVAYLHALRVKFAYEGHPYILFPQCKTSIGYNSHSVKRDVCMQHGVFGYSRSNGVAASFVTWPEVNTRNYMHAFAGGPALH